MIHGGFAWRVGFPVSADANEFAEQLETLKAPDGTVTVEKVLEAQRPEDAPLHDDIEWDDAAAAYKYRIGMVSQAMSALRVIPIDLVKEEPMAPMRALLLTRTVDGENGVAHSYVFAVKNSEQPIDLEVQARQQAILDVRKLAQRIATLPGCLDISEQLIEMIELL